MREGDWEPICGGERTKEVWKEDALEKAGCWEVNKENEALKKERCSVLCEGCLFLDFVSVFKHMILSIPLKFIFPLFALQHYYITTEK